MKNRALYKKKNSLYNKTYRIPYMTEFVIWHYLAIALQKV